MNPWLIGVAVYGVVATLAVVWLSRGLFRRPPNPPLYNHEEEK